MELRFFVGLNVEETAAILPVVRRRHPARLAIRQDLASPGTEPRASGASGPMSDSARWGELERLYHGALERPPDERASFVEKACAHDEWLRRELESLLEHDRPEFGMGGCAQSAPFPHSGRRPARAGRAGVRHRSEPPATLARRDSRTAGRRPGRGMDSRAPRRQGCLALRHVLAGAIAVLLTAA